MVCYSSGSNWVVPDMSRWGCVVVVMVVDLLLLLEGVAIALRGLYRLWRVVAGRHLTMARRRWDRWGVSGEGGGCRIALVVLLDIGCRYCCEVVGATTILRPHHMASGAIGVNIDPPLPPLPAIPPLSRQLPPSSTATVPRVHSAVLLA